MNILILIYADPRLYISIMSMSHYFSNKYLNVDIICLNEDTKDKFDVLDFGKTSNIFFFKAKTQTHLTCYITRLYCYIAPNCPVLG